MKIKPPQGEVDPVDVQPVLRGPHSPASPGYISSSRDNIQHRHGHGTSGAHCQVPKLREVSSQSQGSIQEVGSQEYNT